MDCTGNMAKASLGRLLRVLAICQRYSTPKFCKSCEVIVIYMVVSFTALLNKKIKKIILTWFLQYLLVLEKKKKGRKKEEKGWWCTVPQKYRPDYCSQTPHCFPGTLKTCDLQRQTGVHRRARRTITKDCNHGTSFTATTTKPTKQTKHNNA